MVINLKEKQTEEFFRCLILRALSCWENFSRKLRAGFISYNMGGSIARGSTILSKWSLNF